MLAVKFHGNNIQQCFFMTSKFKGSWESYYMIVILRSSCIKKVLLLTNMVFFFKILILDRSDIIFEWYKAEPWIGPELAFTWMGIGLHCWNLASGLVGRGLKQWCCYYPLRSIFKTGVWFLLTSAGCLDVRHSRLIESSSTRSWILLNFCWFNLVPPFLPVTAQRLFF